MKNEDKISIKIFKLFWVFVIGCLIGYLGMLAFYIILPYVNKWYHIFWISGILGGVTEYFCSYFQERWFGTISWDYTNLFLNLNGRTSIMYCVLWGILGIIFIKLIYPFLEMILNKLVNKFSIKLVTSFVAVFMIFNITISSHKSNASSIICVENIMI